MSDFMNHTLLVWRGLVQRPFYAIATIIMFSLAVGANMAAFGIFYGYQLKPLPYTNPDRLLMVKQTDPAQGLNFPLVAPETYLLLTQQLKSIQSAGLLSDSDIGSIEIGNVMHAASALNITPSLLTTLGAHPVLGRLLSPASGTENGPREVMISAQFWKSAFSGRADAVGKMLTISGKDYQIVGVLPQSFGVIGAYNLYISASLPSDSKHLSNINDFMIVKLAPGVSGEEFKQQLQNMQVQINDHEIGSKYKQHQSYTLGTANPRQVMIQNIGIGKMPVLLQIVALLLLVLAIANTCNLALVRTQTRMQSYALRRMLGANRGIIIRLFLIENLPIWALSFAGACVIGTVTLNELSSGGFFYNPPLNIELGWPVYIFGFLLISVAYLLVILMPSWQIIRQRLNGALGETAKTTISATVKRTQTGFGALQIALATTLLVSSFGFSFNLFQKLHQPHGFETSNRVVANILLPPEVRNIATLQRVVDDVKQTPIAVDAAGAVFSTYPFSGNNFDTYVFPSGNRLKGTISAWAAVVGDYFSTLGIHIKSGQDFNSAVREGQDENVAIISPALAHKIFGQNNALGNSVSDGINNLKVIGISDPVAESPLQTGLDTPEIFVPATTLNQLLKYFPFYGATVIVHVRGPMGNAITLIKHSITHTVPGAVVESIEPYQQIMEADIQLQSIVGWVVAGFALLALILAIIGVYAVNSLIAQRRQSEFGIRAMLGASPSALLRVAMYDAGVMLSIGLVVGLVIGYIFMTALSSLIGQSQGVTVPVMVLAALIIAIIVVVTAWRPALRAITRPVKDLLES